VSGRSAQSGSGAPDGDSGNFAGAASGVGAASATAPTTTAGAGRAVLRLGGASIRFEKRGLLVYALLLLGLLTTSFVSLLIGDYDISIEQVFAALAQQADERLVQYFVFDVRLPRIVAGLFVGVALGSAGAIFQTLSGNPLGSPDIIGFTKGAATGALVVIVLFSGSSQFVALGAVVGGLLTAALVYGLSWRGGAPGYRLVLVGIGVGATLGALNALLVVKASLSAAQSAAHWLAGSLNASLWGEVLPLGGALALLLAAAWSRYRALETLAFGDVISTGLGVRVERSRFILMFVGTLLVAIATAAAGPISFVALVAPHLVKKVTRTSGTALVGSALMGAFLVLVSDLIARRIFAPNELAVGLVTGSLGGAYLIALLIMEWRKQAR
jgi:iron complex transport system permease protein